MARLPERGCRAGRASRSRRGSRRPGAGRDTSSTWTRCTTSSSSGPSPPSPTCSTRWWIEGLIDGVAVGGTAAVFRKVGGLAPLHPDRQRPELRHGDGGGPAGLHRRGPDLGAPMTSTLTTWLVTLVVFQPVLAAVLVALLPQNEKRLVRAWTFLALLLNFGLTVLALRGFDPEGPRVPARAAPARGSPTWASATTWASTGWRSSLMLLTGFLGPLVVLASWSFIESRVKSFHLALLLIQTAMLGRARVAGRHPLLRLLRGDAGPDVPDHRGVGLGGADEGGDEVLPLHPGRLAADAGGDPRGVLPRPAGRRPQLRLLGVLQLARSGQPRARRLRRRARRQLRSLSPLAKALRVYGPWMFLAFAVAFAIKVPMFPVHTWLAGRARRRRRWPGRSSSPG